MQAALLLEGGQGLGLVIQYQPLVALAKHADVAMPRHLNQGQQRPRNLRI